MLLLQAEWDRSWDRLYSLIEERSWVGSVGSWVVLDFGWVKWKLYGKLGDI